MVAIIQKIETLRLFKRPENLNTPWQIILWWELRRLPFNLIVGTTGILTGILLIGIAIFSEKKFGDPIGLGSPLFALFSIIAYGIIANICYTGGWIAELFARRVWKEQAEHFGKIAFVLGMIFSVILTLTPFVVCSVIVLIKMFGIIK